VQLGSDRRVKTDWVWPNPPSRPVGDDSCAGCYNSPGEQDPTPGRQGSRQPALLEFRAQRPRTEQGGCRGCYRLKRQDRGRFWRASGAEGRQDPARLLRRDKEASTGSPPFPSEELGAALTKPRVSLPEGQCRPSKLTRSLLA